MRSLTIVFMAGLGAVVACGSQNDSGLKGGSGGSSASGGTSSGGAGSGGTSSGGTPGGGAGGTTSGGGGPSGGAPGGGAGGTTSGGGGPSGGGAPTGGAPSGGGAPAGGGPSGGGAPAGGGPSGGGAPGGGGAPPSCVGKCGDSNPVPGPGGSCFCDQQCSSTGDCCPDYAQVCGGGRIACAGDVCSRASKEFCCHSWSSGNGWSSACQQDGKSCTGASYCDGPEDCEAGTVCCGTLSGNQSYFTSMTCKASCEYTSGVRVICGESKKCPSGYVCKPSSSPPGYSYCGKP